MPRATTTALPYIDPGETRLIGSDATKLLSSRRLTVLHDRSNVCRNSVRGSKTGNLLAGAVGYDRPRFVKLNVQFDF